MSAWAADSLSAKLPPAKAHGSPTLRCNRTQLPQSRTAQSECLALALATDQLGSNVDLSVPKVRPLEGMVGHRFPPTCSMNVATSFEPIVQGSDGSFAKVAFKTAFAAQSCQISRPRIGNDEPCRFDFAGVDDF